MAKLIGEIGAVNLNVTCDFQATSSSSKIYENVNDLTINVLKNYLKDAVESAPDTKIQNKVQYVTPTEGSIRNYFSFVFCFV